MNETHTLNGIKYVSRLITEEENTLIDRLRNDELGCPHCEWLLDAADNPAHKHQQE